ncbi:Nicotinate-nucleotide adenylyltransferase [Anaerovibrio sp. JC8]|uniref:nicotinate-nucleotide adenylyltransferase n=1 Tax=Anaerovibrio sp. JC8 TaxID=1240085 RepID=UPI000A0D8313|nr:nicotinate-nucleotide adenylyltransferase [Anaerovibrio sp. JC8]ORT98993.1 Nicotinate-nucleotide adenylyltransferase [Anaerovibrio sp. JC8]
MGSKKKRVGIMGGTFDPIHVGHLMTAEAVRDEYNLDRVIFIPAAMPPHKQQQNVTMAKHRYVMTVLATCSNPNFEVSDIEMNRPGPSYTIDTISQLITQYGKNTEFYFITGADTIQEIHTWDRIDELLTLCHFIGASRQGCLPDVNQIKESFGELGKRKIHRLETPELEISSTDIRNRIKKGYSIKYIVPSCVEQYIYKEGLYKD